ncbi:LuxR C-terminal-related transcriptional regulator [Kitasatospora sp. NPDC057223]|uniref:LuxR C-terminal-related transcriptional regulator n=1 Tax=Kitasatospora sp. NPDC057223 TaxID=3346055 RepID=UPI0036393B69
MSTSTPAKAGDPLTPTDLDTLRLVANGRTAEQIAHELHVSYHTISTRLGQIYRKLNVTDRTSAVVTAHQTGLLSLACPPRTLDLTDLREQLAATTARAEQAEGRLAELARQVKDVGSDWRTQHDAVQSLHRQLNAADERAETDRQEIQYLEGKQAAAEARIAAVSSLAAHWSTLPTHSGAAHQLRTTLGEITAAAIVQILDGPADTPAEPREDRRICPACTWPLHYGQTCAEYRTAVYAADAAFMAAANVRGQIDALLAEGKSPQAHGFTEEETAEQLHARRAHPGWEYATTEGPRKAWDHVDMTPEGGGWERNTAAGREGWDRLDYTEESYWRRVVADKRCAICGAHEHGGRDWYQSAQEWLACWPCADGDRPTCPAGERCEGVDCYRRDEHGPRPSEQPPAGFCPTCEGQPRSTS